MCKRSDLSLASIVLALLLGGKSAGQSLVLDPSFGTDGVMTYEHLAGSFATDVNAGPSGEIRVAGYAWDMGYDFFTAGVNDNGSLATAFGGGWFTLGVGTLDDGAATVVIQPDGRSILGGYTQVIDNELALVRLMPDGSLDPSFGANGTVITPFGPFDDACTSLLLEPDGKIIAGGYAKQGAWARLAVARYLPDGTLDPSFAGSGFTIVDSLGGVVDMTRQPDGKLIVLSYYFPGIYGNFCLVRLNADGSPDSTFGTNGVVLGTLAEPFGFAASTVDLAQDGRVIICGDITTGGHNFMTARFTDTGVLDTTFNYTGWASLNIQGYDEVFGASVRENGSIVLAGNTWDGSSTATHHLALVQYDPDGGLDSTFGTNGILFTDLPGGESGTCMTIDGSDRVVCVANTDSAGTGLYAVLRYAANGVGFAPAAAAQAASFVYPNPTTSALYIHIAQQTGGYLELVDVLGQPVTRLKGRITNLDVSTLPPGTFTVRSFDATGSVLGSARFIKQ
jgi:uncharacterized delta-60 repeat protein